MSWEVALALVGANVVSALLVAWIAAGRTATLAIARFEGQLTAVNNTATSAKASAHAAHGRIDTHLEGHP